MTEQDIIKFPEFLLKLLLGLLKAACTESDTFLLVVWAVLMGLLTTPLIAAVSALGLYLVFRNIVQIGAALASNLGFLATVLRDKEIK